MKKKLHIIALLIIMGFGGASCGLKSPKYQITREGDLINQSIDDLRKLVKSKNYDLIAHKYCKEVLVVRGYLDSDLKVSVTQKQNMKIAIHEYFLQDQGYIDGTRAILLNHSNKCLIFDSALRIQNSGKKYLRIGDMILVIDETNKIFIEELYLDKSILEKLDLKN